MGCGVDEPIGTDSEVIHHRVGQPGAETCPRRRTTLASERREHALVGAERQIAGAEQCVTWTSGRFPEMSVQF